MRPFEYAVPGGVGEARRVATEGAAYKGAGLDLLDLMKEGILAPARLVSLQRIPGLSGVHQEGDSFLVGAGTTLAALGSHEGLAGRLPGLAEAALEAATPQVRSRATVAGNLLQRPRCWYFRSAEFHCAKKGGRTCFAVDGRNRYHALFGRPDCPVVHASNLAPMLVALGATAEIEGEDGRRTLPVSELLVHSDAPDGPEHALRPGEVLVSLSVPAPGGLACAWKEAREKQSFDWPVAAAAVALRLADGRIQEPRVVLGAVAPVPWRAPAAEEVLAGEAPGEELFAKAAEAAFQGARDLGENGYRVPLGKAVLRDTLAAAAARGGRRQ